LKNVKVLCALTFLLAAGAFAQVPDGGFWGGLPAGPFTPAFRLIEASDATRSFPSVDGTSVVARPLRIYVWYPAKKSADERMRLDDYVRMALEDFRTSILPVPLSKGLSASVLQKLRDSSVEAVRGAAAAPGKFPLLVLGQGLYYESPLCHFVLCEFLAAHGYVVATSPLVGTRYRLVNITVEDVETEVRDMEFVMAEARGLPFVDPARLGVIGYDLGGMAGLIMSMRNPDVSGFLSLDSGILDAHHSGLPVTHPGYHEERFRVPWMHMLQARFIRPEKDRAAAPSLLERKAFGPSYLVHVPTSSHGQFSSYAALGIDRAVPGFWGPPSPDSKPIYESICRTSLAFLDSCFKKDPAALEELLRAGAAPGTGLPAFKIESKTGAAAPPAEDGLVDLIIDKGIGQARTSIERLHADHPGVPLIDESVLNWLGVHFLYWWGREEEAVGVFELNTLLYPGSSNAYDSLGEAYAAQGRKDDAIRSYRKALELDPKNASAKAALERLSPPAKKDPA
jgi:pimeloyl-ACP methyl ester carboxylesterase